MIMKTLVNLLGEHPFIVNILLGPVTVHHREVSLQFHSILYLQPHTFHVSIA